MCVRGFVGYLVVTNAVLLAGVAVVGVVEVGR